MNTNKRTFPPPTMANIGEILFEDGTLMLVPQPDPTAWVTLSDAYVNTLPELPAAAVVWEYVAEHPSSNAKRRTDPLWAVVCIVLGAILSVGTGAFLITLGLMR